MAIQVVVALLLILAVNWLLATSITAVRSRPLVPSSPEDLRHLQTENSILQKQIATAKRKTSTSHEERLPSVAELKELASNCKLGIRRLERTTVAVKAKKRPVVRYTVTLLGSLENQVELLRTLNERYLIDCDATTLQKGNDDGSLVAMSLSIAVSES